MQLDALAQLLVGRVEIDLSGLTYINSWGTRAWSRLLSAARVDELVYTRCAVSFVLAASMTGSFLGQGKITSFYAPYACAECELDELVLLEVTEELRAHREAPDRACPRCARSMSFDEIAEAYFAFLDP
jgi:hypothetical protein